MSARAAGASVDPQALAAQVRAGLRAVARPANAPAMQAYMKSSMPFLGVSAPDLRRTCRALYSGVTFADAAGWREAVRTLWRGAGYREERYAAIELTGARPARPFQDMQALPLYEEMVVTGAWWDLVDSLAKHRLGGLLRAHPVPMHRAMLAWARDPDPWKRRSAILCQLAFKQDTDLGLLYACIAPSLGSREFFLAKAIGWALRQHAWTDPEAVRSYVRDHEHELAPLSRREALKNLG